MRTLKELEWSDGDFSIFSLTRVNMDFLSNIAATLGVFRPNLRCCYDTLPDSLMNHEGSEGCEGENHYSD